KPTDAGEEIELARFCQYSAHLYGAAAQLYLDAFASKPSLGEVVTPGHRYNAACCAVLAGCGRGKDNPPLHGPARARWRNQAGDWLRTELLVWSRALEGDMPQPRALAQKRLQWWQRDADLAGVRDEAALARLPNDEQEAWRKLWAEVAAVLERAEKR